MLNRTILQGDVLDKLAEIPDESIDCIISSPPYWGLRDYGVEGQLGLEPDFRDYLSKMSKIMDELNRVLKKTGTCWINLGDSYSNSESGKNGQRGLHGENCKCNSCLGTEAQVNFKKQLIQIKSRFAIPERFYINCIDSGWIARNHIPWYKSNSMPSSVKDRFTNKWESIFFFAKAQKYYFNLDAVREKTITKSKPFNIRVRENITGHAQAKLGERSWTATEEEKEKYNKDGTKKDEDYLENQSSKYKEESQSNSQRLGKFRNKGRYTDKKLNNRNGLGKSTLDKKQDSTLGADGKPIPTYKGFNERWENARAYDPNIHTGPSRAVGQKYQDELTNNPNYKGKNPGDVFFINPKPFAAAHFATFPIDLPLKILKCSCPPNGIVLDPFFGAGTVGVAAEKLGLQWMGIELNADYITIARDRLEKYKHQKLEAFA